MTIFVNAWQSTCQLCLACYRSLSKENKTFVELYEIECECRWIKWQFSIYWHNFFSLISICRVELIEAKSSKCGCAVVQLMSFNFCCSIKSNASIDKGRQKLSKCGCIYTQCLRYSAHGVGSICGPWRSHKLRLFSPLLTLLFQGHLHTVFGVLLYAISEFCDTDFAGQVVYKPWVLSVSSEALIPITAILIPAGDCVLLLHQLVIGPVTVHLM